MPTLTIDDRDPSITYSAGWQQAGTALEFNSTTSWTISPRTTATLLFRGSSVSVYGTIGARRVGSVAPLSSYILNGGTPVNFRATQGARAQYSQLFFQNPSALPTNRLHNLTIVHPSETDAFFLDFFLVDVPAETGVTPATSTSTTRPIVQTTKATTSSTSPATVTVTDRLTMTETTLPSGTASSTSAQKIEETSGLKAAAVAGPVVAAIVFLVAMVVGFVFWQRQKRRAKSRLSTMEYFSSPSAFKPDSIPGSGTDTSPQPATAERDYGWSSAAASTHGAIPPSASMMGTPIPAQNQAYWGGAPGGGGYAPGPQHGYGDGGSVYGGAAPSVRGYPPATPMYR